MSTSTESKEKPERARNYAIRTRISELVWVWRLQEIEWKPEFTVSREDYSKVEEINKITEPKWTQDSENYFL